MEIVNRKNILLGDYIELQYGKPLIKSKRENGKYPVYGSNGIVDYNNKFCFEGPGVVIGRKGTVGSVKYENSNFWPIDTTYVLKLKNNNEDLKFWYYFLQTIGLEEMNTHSAVPGLSRERVYNIRVNMISNLEDKKRIVKILSTIDKKVELNNEIKESLQKISSELYKRWFVDFEFPNKEGKPYKSNGGKMVNSEMGPIPKNWYIATISQITKVNKRGISPTYTDDKENGIPVINQRCVRDGILIEEAVRYHDISKKIPSPSMYLSPYDVLINSMGVGTLGRVSQITNPDKKRLIHSCITILRSDQSKITQIMLGSMIKNMQTKIENMGTGTTGQTSLNNNFFGEEKVLVPDMTLQNKFSRYINNFMITIDKKGNENDTLIKMRNLLLPLLMEGKIDISSIKIY